MSRPVASVLTATADLARALTGPAPTLPPRVLRAARRAVDLVAAAVRNEVAEHGAEQAAARLLVSSPTLRRWRAPGGWLRATQEPAQGD